MMHEPGLVGLAVLAEALDDADLALLHDVDHLAQAPEQHGTTSAEDGETDDEPATLMAAITTAPVLRRGLAPSPASS